MKQISVFLLPFIIQTAIHSMNSSQDWARSLLDSDNFGQLHDVHIKQKLSERLIGEFKQNQELLCHIRRIYGEPFELLTMYDMSHKNLDSHIPPAMNGLNNSKFKIQAIDAIKQLKKRLIAFNYQQGGTAWLCNLKTKECAQFDDHEDYSVLGFALNEENGEAAVIWSDPETEQKIIDVYKINMQFNRAKSNV